MRKLRASRRDTGGADRSMTPISDRAIAAVLATLKGVESLSGRAIKRGLASTFPRSVIEWALKAGVQCGALTAEPVRFQRAVLYRVADIRSVTPTGTPTASVPVSRGLEAPPAGIPAETIQCSVTPFAVTQGERVSTPLQKTPTLGRYTPVTDGGTLRKRSHVTISGTLDTNEGRLTRKGNLEPISPVAHQMEVPASGETDQAVASGHCCGTSGALLRCKLCRRSPTYWQLPALHGLNSTPANPDKEERRPGEANDERCANMPSRRSGL
jgi:hypothetical protein